MKAKRIITHLCLAAMFVCLIVGEFFEAIGTLCLSLAVLAMLIMAVLNREILKTSLWNRWQTAALFIWLIYLPLAVTALALGARLPFAMYGMVTFSLFVIPSAIACEMIGNALQKKRMVRAAANHCLDCGYDLRASLDRCPECGTPAPATRPCPKCQFA